MAGTMLSQTGILQKNNIGLIARVPLDEGGLSGRMTLETTFAQGDFRRRYFTGDRLRELVKRTAGLKELLDGEAKTLPELSLRYVLSWDEVSTETTHLGTQFLLWP